MRGAARIFFARRACQRGSLFAKLLKMPGLVRDKQPDVSAATPSTAETSAWSEVTKLADESFRVRLGGSFGQGWLASLCRGLAAQNISIERAHAMRTRNSSWIAEFTARALPGAPLPESVPYLGLAARAVAPDGQPLSLDRFELEACYDGTLKLAFEAQDALGLLGTLLEKLAGLGLYPVEMHIETLTQRVSDVLWLCAAEGGAPGDLARAALERMLKLAVRLPRA
jgi:hypothetical protein